MKYSDPPDLSFNLIPLLAGHVCMLCKLVAIITLVCHSKQGKVVSLRGKAEAEH